MCILNRCTLLASLTSLITKDVAHGRLQVAKYARLTPRARYASTFSHQRLLASKRALQQWHPQPACQLVPQRHCSDMLRESKSGDEAKVDDTSLPGPTSKYYSAMIQYEHVAGMCMSPGNSVQCLNLYNLSSTIDNFPIMLLMMIKT